MHSRHASRQFRLFNFIEAITAEDLTIALIPGSRIEQGLWPGLNKQSFAVHCRCLALPCLCLALPCVALRCLAFPDNQCLAGCGWYLYSVQVHEIRLGSSLPLSLLFSSPLLSFPFLFSPSGTVVAALLLQADFSFFFSYFLFLPRLRSLDF